jgi:hypothetical protein
MLNLELWIAKRILNISVTALEYFYSHRSREEGIQSASFGVSV